MTYLLIYSTQSTHCDEHVDKIISQRDKAPVVTQLPLRETWACINAITNLFYGLKQITQSPGLHVFLF